jgi:hypothetical protein
MYICTTEYCTRYSRPMYRYKLLICSAQWGSLRFLYAEQGHYSRYTYANDDFNYLVRTVIYTHVPSV